MWSGLNGHPQYYTDAQRFRLEPILGIILKRRLKKKNIVVDISMAIVFVVSESVPIMETK